MEQKNVTNIIHSSQNVSNLILKKINILIINLNLKNNDKKLYTRYNNRLFK